MRAHHEDWEAYYHHLANVKVSGQRLSSLAEPLLRHTFTLPLEQLRRGMVYAGNNARLRSVVAGALRERRGIKVGVLGGSITYGHGSSDPTQTAWPALLQRWLDAALPGSSVRNGALPATPSAYMAVCLEWSVDANVDVVVSEYALNDAWIDTISENHMVVYHERYLRRLLALPKRPAVIMLQTWADGTWRDPGDPGYHPFHVGVQDLYGALAQYYDIGWLSARNALYRLTRVTQEWQIADVLTDDRRHATDAGHAALADLVVWLLQSTVIDLLVRPPRPGDVNAHAQGGGGGGGSGDDGARGAQLPEPMFEGNTVPSSPMCLQFDALIPHVVEARGFEFVEERGGKKGYVGSSPGSLLSVRVDTVRGAGRFVIAQLAHLRSYEHMGIAVVTCSSGCTCEPTRVNAHRAEPRTSQTYLASIKVTQSAACVVSVTIAPETDSGEHKFKVSGLILSDAAMGDDEPIWYEFLRPGVEFAQASYGGPGTSHTAGL